MGEQPFEYSGFASLDDLKTSVWKRLYDKLDVVQKEFLDLKSQFLSAEYPGPHRTLYNWSRVWEYPYVLYHMLRWKEQPGYRFDEVVLDFGSGVTFFPFALVREGFNVLAMDNLPVVKRDFEKATGVLSSGPGAVSFKSNVDLKIPLQDNEVSAICCISVLEHIKNMPDMVREFARVLKPKGLLFLTIDIDLNGNYEISPSNYQILRAALVEYFDYCVSEKVSHPSSYLLSNNGPFPVQGFGVKKILRYLKYTINMSWQVTKPLSLACQGFVLSRKEGAMAAECETV